MASLRGHVAIALVLVLFATSMADQEISTTQSNDSAESRPYVSSHELGISLSSFFVILAVLKVFMYVNSTDPAVKYYTWDVLGTSSTVFCASIVFHSVHGSIISLAGGSHVASMIVCVVFLLLLMLLNYADVYMAQQDNRPQCAIPEESRRYFGLNYELITVKLVRCKTFGSLLSYMTAFAWVEFWGQVQITSSRHASRWLVLDLAGAFIVHLLVTRFFQQLRNVDYADQDGNVDADQRMWLAESARNEIAAGCMQLSFVSMQFLIYMITKSDETGCMPDPFAEEPCIGEHLTDHIVLGIVGISAIAWICNLVAGCAFVDPENSVHENDWKIMDHRQLRNEFFVDYFGFLACWAGILAFTWFLFDIDSGLRRGSSNELLVRTILALIVTLATLLIIRVLDVIEHRLREAGNVRGQKALDGIVATLGVMMGFTWERAFVRNTETMAIGIIDQISTDNQSTSLYERVVNGFIAMWMCISLVGASYYYISPRTLEAKAYAALRKLYNTEPVNGQGATQGNGRDFKAGPAYMKNWSSLSSDEKDTAIYLGYDHRTWDHIDNACADVSSLDWKDLSQPQQNALQRLGYTQEVWDATFQGATAGGAFAAVNSLWGQGSTRSPGSSSSNYCGPRSQDNRSCSSTLFPAYRKNWDWLSETDKEIAAKLGYNSLSWNQRAKDDASQKADVESRAWNDLSFDQQSGLQQLGYTPWSWDQRKARGCASTSTSGYCGPRGSSSDSSRRLFIDKEETMTTPREPLVRTQVPSQNGSGQPPPHHPFPWNRTQ